MTDVIKDQPPPVVNANSETVWDMVIADVRALKARDAAEHALLGAVALDMSERHRVGVERYGTPLATHNGRDFLVDAYQEALDCCVYLRGEYMEREEDLERDGRIPYGPLVGVYERAIQNAIAIRLLIHNRMMQRER